MKNIQLTDKSLIKDIIGADINFAIDENFVATVVCHTKDKVIFENQDSLYYMYFPYPEDYEIGTTLDVTTLSPIYELSDTEQDLIYHILSKV